MRYQIVKDCWTCCKTLLQCISWCGIIVSSINMIKSGIIKSLIQNLLYIRELPTNGGYSGSRPIWCNNYRCAVKYSELLGDGSFSACQVCSLYPLLMTKWRKGNKRWMQCIMYLFLLVSNPFHASDLGRTDSSRNALGPSPDIVSILATTSA